MPDRELMTAMSDAARRVDAFLEACLVEGRRPPRLVAALRHALFAGGKRMRPFLVIEAARLFGIEGNAPLHVAAALEAIHCYSLIHDDLPAMDNDDMRRGKPTVHRAYDEATAILAGDSLLTLAFSILVRREAGISASRRMRLVGQLAEAAGIDGMIGGQMLDLAAEGRFDARPPRQSIATIRRLQSLKTGALIVFAMKSAASLAPRATAAEKRALVHYGRELGLAFQIRDDLLDAEGQSTVVGKAVGKDATAGKATFIGHLGLDGARRELARASEAGEAALHGVFGSRAAVLSALLRYNQTRDR